MKTMMTIAKWMLVGFLGLVVISIIGVVADSVASDKNPCGENQYVGQNDGKCHDWGFTKEELEAWENGNRDGKFEFTTHSFKCGINSVKREWGSSEKALGEFCRLDFSVKNIGNEAWWFDSSDQLLVDDRGRTFEYNSSISDDKIWMENVNPGLTISGFLYFDVPLGTNIKYFEFHDSMFSDGIKIPVNM